MHVNVRLIEAEGWLVSREYASNLITLIWMDCQQPLVLNSNDDSNMETHTALSCITSLSPAR